MNYPLSAAILSLCLYAGTATSSEKLSVYGIVFNKPTFDSLLPSLSDKLGVETAYHALGMPYSDNIENELIYNPNVDIANLLTRSIPRIDEGNWIIDLSDQPEIVAASQQHFEHIKKTIHRDGRLIGLGTGAIVQIMPLVDLDAYQKLGLSEKDLPSDWHQLHTQIAKSAEQGHQSFFYPAWHRDGPGLSLSFLVEVWNRGGYFVDPKTQDASLPTSTGPAYQTLLDWRRVWNSGAVPKDILDQTFVEYRNALYNNSFAISVQSSEMLLLPREPNRATTRTIPLPRAIQNWGTLMAMIATVPRRKEYSEEALGKRLRVLTEISRGTGMEEFAFAEKFLLNEGLLSVYPDYMHSARARKILRSRLSRARDVDVLLNIYENVEAPELFWNSLWTEEFSVFLQGELSLFLGDRSISPEAVINRLNHKMKELRQNYGY